MWSIGRRLAFTLLSRRATCPQSSSFCNAQADPLETTRARLLYQSKKRGILENDILLGDFADEFLSKLTEKQLQEYDKMINGEHMEWDLYYYLSGKKAPPPELSKLSAFKLVKNFVDERKLQRS